MKRTLLAAALTAGLLLGTPALQAQAKSAYCNDFIKATNDPQLTAALKTLGDETLIKKDPAKAKANIHKVTITFHNLQKNAPADQKPDLKAVEGFFADAEKFVEVMGTSKDNKAILAAAKKVTDGEAKLTPALGRLEKYTLKNCGAS